MEPVYTYRQMDLICIDQTLMSLMERDTANSNAAYGDFPIPMWVEIDVFLRSCALSGLYLAIDHVLESQSVKRQKEFKEMMIAYFDECFGTDDDFSEDREVLVKRLSLSPQGE